MSTIDRDAVRAGALMTLAFLAPTAVTAWIIDAVTDIESDDAVTAVLFVPVIAGFVMGGFAAGRRAPRTPFVHATIAVVAAYAVVALVALIRLTVADSDISGGAFVFNLFLASGLGLIGAVAATVSNARDKVEGRRRAASDGLDAPPEDRGWTQGDSR